MVKTIKKTNVINFLVNAKKNFTASFTKLNGDTRVMYANFKTGYDTVKDLDSPYLLVKSVFDNKEIRSINIDTLTDIAIGNDTYKVVA